MVSLFYAARGLWRVVTNFIREAVRSSLLAVMHMVSVHIPVLIFLAVFVLAFSGFGLLVIKVLAIVLHPVTVAARNRKQSDSQSAQILAHINCN